MPPLGDRSLLSRDLIARRIHQQTARFSGLTSRSSRARFAASLMRYRVPHRSAAAQAGLTPVLGPARKFHGVFSVIPFAIERIDHVVFRVLDLEQSIQFYRQLLGCEVVRHREHLGLVHLRAGASMIDLISVDGKLGSKGGATSAKEARNVDHLCLRIEPFNEGQLVEHLLHFGISPLGKAEVNFGAEGDGLSLYFPDPDGNLIELKGPSSV